LERHHAAVNAEVLVDEHLEKMKMKHLAQAWRSWLHVYNQVRKICVCQRLEKSKWSWTRYLVHVEAY